MLENKAPARFTVFFYMFIFLLDNNIPYNKRLYVEKC